MVLAVEPVETMSTPASCRPRARSARPVLSYTLINARRIALRCQSSYCRLSSGPGHAAGGHRGQHVHQQSPFDDLDPFVQGGFVVVIEYGYGCWASIGPVSVPASTRCTLQPVTLTPYSSASGTACAPGNAGSSAGWVLMIRPMKRERKWGPRIFMKPADTIRSGSCTAVASVIAASQSRGQGGRAVSRHSWAPTPTRRCSTAGQSRSTPTATILAG